MDSNNVLELLRAQVLERNVDPTRPPGPDRTRRYHRGRNDGPCAARMTASCLSRRFRNVRKRSGLPADFSRDVAPQRMGEVCQSTRPFLVVSSAWYPPIANMEVLFRSPDDVNPEGIAVVCTCRACRLTDGS
jgi:hypothetical protein